MAGINQGLAALNQVMSLVQQMLQQRDQRMTYADAALLYSRVGRVYFDGTGDALDFINTIESRLGLGIRIIRGFWWLRSQYQQRLRTGSCSLYSLT